MSSRCQPTHEPSSPVRQDSVTPSEYKTADSFKMKIQSLLNPSAMGNPAESSTTPSPPLTPAYTAAQSSAFSTPQSTSAAAVSTGKGQKLAKHDRSFANGLRAAVNFPVFELYEEPACLSQADQDELYRKHKQFKVEVCEKKATGSISDHTRHIPYSSDKKDFLEKTGRDGFNVFEYNFCLPGDADGKAYTVMWDYENGLTRITPFFKACKYSKTTPAKALSVNAGVKELSHSITGGALKAQGYWLPYQCARAICLTFCWNIRWPLVHIFGPSFVRDCVKPNEPDYGNFKIPQEIVRCATLEAESWKPTRKNGRYVDGIPRSAPQEVDTISRKELRPRSIKPRFKQGSPFESDGYATDDTRGFRIATPLADSPGISPKSSFHEHTITSSGWTSINRPRNTSSPPSPPNNSPVASLSNSLLAQPHFASWRDADPAQLSAGLQRAVKMPTAAHDKKRAAKRRRSSNSKTKAGAAYTDSHSTSDADVSESESDDADILISPPRGKKRARYHHAEKDVEMSDAASPKMRRNKKAEAKSTHFSAEDARAANLLLSLCHADDKLANGPNGLIKVRSQG